MVLGAGPMMVVVGAAPVVGGVREYLHSPIAQSKKQRSLPELHFKITSQPGGWSVQNMGLWGVISNPDHDKN